MTSSWLHDKQVAFSKAHWARTQEPPRPNSPQPNSLVCVPLLTRFSTTFKGSVWFHLGSILLSLVPFDSLCFPPAPFSIKFPFGAILPYYNAILLTCYQTTTLPHYDTRYYCATILLCCYRVMKPMQQKGRSDMTVALGHLVTLTLWHFGTLALWHFGTLALWHFGILAFWHFGIFALWHFGILAF